MARLHRIQLICVALSGLAACHPEVACPAGSERAGEACVPTDGGAADGGMARADGSPATDGCVSAEETCNGADDDCDGEVDEALVRDCGSTEGSCTLGEETCSMGEWSNCSGTRPAAEERCDGLDDDCDGEIDETCGCTPGETQPCGSSEGECEAGVQTCGDDAAWGACSGATPPDAELCDGKDNDCDGVIDNGNPGGGGACGETVGECAAGVERCVGGRIECMGAVLPIPETCDAADNDCDGATDEGVTTTFYRDADGDGRGTDSTPTEACSAPGGFVTQGGDCDDGDGSTYPGARDICDGKDNDCGGSLGVDSTFECVRGASVSCTTSCGSTGSGSCTSACDVPTAGSCMAPSETCNYRDDDCDGVVDDGVSELGPNRLPAGSDVDEVRIVPRLFGSMLYTLKSNTLRAQLLDTAGIPLGSQVVVSSNVATFDATAVSGDTSVVIYRDFDEVYARRVGVNGTGITVTAARQLTSDAHVLAGVAVAASTTDVIYAWVRGSGSDLYVARGTTSVITGEPVRRLTYWPVDTGQNFTQVEIGFAGGDDFTLAYADSNDFIQMARVTYVAGRGLRVEDRVHVGAGSHPILAGNPAGDRVLGFVSTTGSLVSYMVDAGTWTPRGRLSIGGGLPYAVGPVSAGIRRSASVTDSGGRWVFAAVEGSTLRVVAQSPVDGRVIETDTRTVAGPSGVDLASRVDQRVTLGIASSGNTVSAHYGCL